MVVDTQTNNLDDGLCPRGPSDCPIYERLRLLKQGHAKLAELSQTDALTGLYNFRYLISALDRELERSRRSGHPTALIMIDLDRFKEINDRWGHQVGNRALERAARIVARNIRKIDIACRYGGEEFTVVLPGTRLRHALEVAERLRHTLSRNPLDVGSGQLVEITASFGVDVYLAGESLGARDFIARADQHLLQAKRNGRNCIRSKDMPRKDLSCEEKHLLGFDF